MEKASVRFPRLFEPAAIGAMKLKNRIVRAPMGVDYYDAEGFVQDSAVAYFDAAARGGAGLIITQSSQATRVGRSPGRAGTWDDKFIPGLARVADAVHKHDTKVAWQVLYHGKLLLLWLDQIPRPWETRVLGPSAIPWSRTGTAPQEASLKDIEFLADEISEAARRIKDAGFDAVEIHGAHGYGLSQWLSPRDNKRTDEYGGSPEKRARFLCDVISRTREKVGRHFPIILRFSGSDFLPGGISIEQSVIQAPLFVKAGADALHISACEYESTQWQYLPYLFPDGAIVHLAEAIKKAVDVPVITVGKIWDPAFAEKILENGQADFVAIGRALLADPELPEKARQGRTGDIRRCIYCNNCMNRSPHPDYKGLPWPSCTVNTALHRAKDFTDNTAAFPRKVMVVGGGIAGMEAARILAERGHRAALYEKEKKLGGQFLIAARQPEKNGYASFIEYQIRGMEKAGVEVFLGTEVTLEHVERGKPDAVVIATGAIPRTLEIPGAGEEFVVQANDLIAGKVKAGDRVLVAGGRMVGMEVALSLAEEGKTVTLATRHRLGGDELSIEKNIFRELRNRLFDIGVQVHENAPLVEIVKGGAYILFHGEQAFVRADTVVLAVGAMADNALGQQVKAAGYQVYAVGDCVKPRDALLATKEGAEAGLAI